MRHRWVVGLAIVGVLLSVVPIGKRVAMNFIPVDDESRFELTVTAAEGRPWIRRASSASASPRKSAASQASSTR